MLRKLTKAERRDGDARPKTDDRQDERHPYSSRAKAFGPDPSCDCTPEDHRQGYKDSLDVTTFTQGHSPRRTQPRSRWLMFANIALATEVKKRQKRNGKPTSAEFDELLRGINNRRIEFMHLELDLALTMTQIAAAAGNDLAKREQSTRRARKAYEFVLRFRDKVNATATQRHSLARKLTHLHLLLGNLGERFQSLPFAA